MKGLFFMDDSDHAIAYVDGSFNAKKKKFSYGVVIIHQGKTYYISGTSKDKNLINMRNVAGEIYAAQKVMYFCTDHNISEIDIYYDFYGIEKWCNGDWIPKKYATRKYKELYDKIKDSITITFIKVKSHSGDILNDLADKLARDAFEISTSTN
jgi:ribonuclease HI